METPSIDGHVHPQPHHKRPTGPVQNVVCDICQKSRFSINVIYLWALKHNVCINCVGSDKKQALDLINYYRSVTVNELPHEFAYHIRAEVQRHYKTGPGFAFDEALVFFDRLNSTLLSNVIRVKQAI